VLKRSFDVIAAGLGLLALSPLLFPAMILVWWQDKRSPFYVAARVGRHGEPFKMIKLRSMAMNADQSGVDSTGADDPRITPIGHFIRRTKLDELSQLWNVLVGDMSLVGPRPNVKRETDLYTSVERGLLAGKPGITDFASIVFADEADILKGLPDPDIAYNQLIRPGKGMLGLFYIQRRSFLLDVYLCLLTVLALFSRRHALAALVRLLSSIGASDKLQQLASRSSPLVPMAPPGSDEVVTSREGAADHDG
jgi:lipopolysaccharide/colanic/teichoic acid biosynthesis glycosyltransferase